MKYYEKTRDSVDSESRAFSYAGFRSRLSRGRTVGDLQQTADLHKEGGKHQRDDRHELNENVQGRTGGVLERVADGIADHRGLMGG